jgi:hypothetical protein
MTYPARSFLFDLLTETPNPRTVRERCGIPHPLAHFAADGQFEDGYCADVILGFIQATVFEEQASMAHEAAHWFLFESQRAFLFACTEAGIDAEKLRGHLRLCEQLSPDEMDELLEERERRGNGLLKKGGE